MKHTGHENKRNDHQKSSKSSCSNKFFLLVLLEIYEGQDIHADIATKTGTAEPGGLGGL